MNQPRVLIVDDDPALLQALPEALRLRMNGVTVDTADSATAALQRIAALDYDAIVTMNFTFHLRVVEDLSTDDNRAGTADNGHLSEMPSV